MLLKNELELNNTEFGFKDYAAMYKAAGFRLPISYFLNNHLFDLLQSTDTHTWVQKEQFVDNPANFEHGVLYMSSWTHVIKESLFYLIDNAHVKLSELALIDIGCGKGKVLCVWNKIFKNHPHIPIVGVDYSQTLLRICATNLAKIGASNTQLFNEDATAMNFCFDKRINVFYLYNPFDDTILRQFILNISNKPCYVIYNNPIHGGTLLESGFRIVTEVTGWHPNATYTIYQLN